MHNNYKIKKTFAHDSAFTLAEVLIVIGIIGIIAQMTIPTLMKNTETTQRVVGLKKAYSTLSQAYTMAVNDNGTPDGWNIGTEPGDGPGAVNFLNVLAPYFKVTKNCGTTLLGCFKDITYRYLNGGEWTNFETITQVARAQLADGSSFAIWTYGGCVKNNGTIQSLQSICGEFIYDVNGFKGPNQLGLDTFYFYISKNGIMPVGSEMDTLDSTFSFDGSCKLKSTAMGRGCTAWMIYNENQDYAKDNCTDLAWGGKTKCN